MSRARRLNRKTLGLCLLLSVFLITGTTLFQMAVFLGYQYPRRIDEATIFMNAAIIFLGFALISLLTILRMRKRVLERLKESGSP